MSGININQPPWNQTVTRNLCDRLYEKRKQGAQDVQALVRDISLTQFDKEKINYIIDYILENLLAVPNPNHKKGGLIALSAVALGLGNVSTNMNR